MKLRPNLNQSDILDSLRKLLRRTRLSLFETLFLIAALVFAAGVAFFYFSKVQPLNSRVSALQNRSRDLRLRIEKVNTDERRRIDQAANAEKILESLSNFEGYLKPDERGMTQIINEVDGLGKAYKVNVGDTTYRVAAPEALIDENGNPKPQTVSSEKELKIYPALGIDMTVIGDYPNLRRFLGELERSNQFLIINSLAFQGEADQVRRDTTRNGGGRVQLGSPGSIPVSLRLELDTYFRKPVGKPQ